MTVRQKMDNILSKNPLLLDSGEFRLDLRPHGVIQNPNSSEIIVVSESRDDIDDNGIPLTKVMFYKNLKDFFDDYPPSY